MSGSLDDKVRMWNIHDNQVVDWSDVREMVTAASFSADGKVLIFTPTIIFSKFPRSHLPMLKFPAYIA